MTPADDADLAEFQELALPGLLGLDEEVGPEATGGLIAERAAQCLQEQGFAVPTQALLPSSSADQTSFVESRRQVLSEFEFAREFGFGIAPSGAESAQTASVSPLQTHLLTLDPAEAARLGAAVFGEPESRDGPLGCLPRAAQEVQAETGQQAWLLFGVYAQEINDLTNSDPRVQALHDQYADCMTQRGYDYKAPLDARFAASRRFSSWFPTAQVANPDAGSFVGGLTDESRSTLDELISQEVREALDSLTCEAMIRGELVLLHAEIETAWIARNGDRVALELAELESS